MAELKKHIRVNGIDYELNGDYYVPMLIIPEDNRPIGKFGVLHREYLKEHHRARYESLVLTCELWTYLADLNEQAMNRFETIVEQMKKAENVTEALKEHQQMAWVGAMNNIRNRAEEIILKEMIYV